MSLTSVLKSLRHVATRPQASPTALRSVRLRAALTLVVVGVMMLAFAPSAGAVPSSFWGIAIGSPTTGDDATRMEDSKVASVRFLLSWPQVQPKKGEFHWPDGLVTVLASHGIRPLPFVGGSPKWATHSSNHRKPPLKGKAKKAWKTFLTKAVKRYKKGGKFWDEHPNIPEKPVKEWQIWNEPNLQKEFPPTPSPKKYGKLLKISDQAIKKGDKKAKLVLAGLSGKKLQKASTRAPNYLKRLYKVKKAKKHFDVVALHPYAKNNSTLKSRIKKMRKAMKAGHDKKTALWLTELGYGSGPKDRFGLNKGSAKSQAKALKKSFKLVLHHRKSWRIKRLYWFDWRDPVKPPEPAFCSFCPFAGLLKADDTPKPAYSEFRHFTLGKG